MRGGRWRILRLASIDRCLGLGRGGRIKSTLEDEEIEEEGAKQWPATRAKQWPEPEPAPAAEESMRATN